MPRYIDADLVEKKLVEEGFHCPTMPISVLIKSIPTADVRENVRGEWKKGGEQPYFRKHFDIVVCSVCNKRGEQRWNFCPNCGADMRGEKDGE